MPERTEGWQEELRIFLFLLLILFLISFPSSFGFIPLRNRRLYLDPLRQRGGGTGSPSLPKRGALPSPHNAQRKEPLRQMVVMPGPSLVVVSS